MASPAATPTPVPFPQPQSARDPDVSATPPDSPANTRRPRTSTNASTASSRIRTASIKLMETNPPPGMWAATGTTASRAPSLKDIRRGSFGSDGWNEQTQRHRAGSRTSQEDRKRPSRQTSGNAVPMDGTEPFPAVTEEDIRQNPSGVAVQDAPKHDAPKKDAAATVELRQSLSTAERSDGSVKPEPSTGHGQYANGYIPPPKLPWTRSFAIGMKSFWKWFLTIPGFLITLYGLNVVAWGGMLFLLLCNASPAMCVPDCNDINSPRRKWIEYDSQILNALFCVTGFGLAPWRFRDLYWLGWWRIGGSKRTEIGIRRLAGIHRGWFRLPGSEQLHELADGKSVDPEDPAIPIPAKATPDAPPTGIRAPPTKGWKMDFVVWNNVWNTFFQIVLCFYMWHYNRIERPSWATGLFVGLGCTVAGIAGIMMWHEGKNIKKIEGVPMNKGSSYENMPTDVEGIGAHNTSVVSNPGGAAKS